MGSGQPVALAGSSEAAVFGTGNGIPPTGGVNVINNASVGGPLLDRQSESPSSGLQDENLDGALCLRALANGVDPVTGQKLTGPVRGVHRRLSKSIDDIRASGELGGRPVVVFTGRNDAILPPNHTSRAYYGLNQSVEGGDSHMRYYEVLNAQHLDAFNAFAGFDVLFVPLHHYFIEGLNLMYDHLKNGTQLPASQVVRTVPRGGIAGAAPQITPANVPSTNPTPDPADVITFADGVLAIPN